MGLFEQINSATLDELKELQSKIEKELGNQTEQYTFVSRRDDIDFIRIIREAPKNTPFILVEERTRKNQPVGWSLFVHTSIINTFSDPDVGYGEIEQNGEMKKLYSYRVLVGVGKCPGVIRKEIEKYRRDLNPKQSKTTVSYL